MFGQRRRGASFIVTTLMTVGLVAVTGESGPVSAADEGEVLRCTPVVYLAQGTSVTVEGVTVTATLNTARESVAGAINPYAYFLGALFEPVGFVGWPASFETSWEFDPPIPAVRFETQYHTDGIGETFTLTARNSNLASPQIWTTAIVDQNTTVQTVFSSPADKIDARFSPEVGQFASYLIMCIPIRSATVQAPSGSMVTGEQLPSLVATAFVTPGIVSTAANTPVTFDQEPTCGLEDGLGNSVVLSSSTPAGTYAVVCVGGTATGFELLTYLDGVFVVEEYRRGFPEDYLERRLAAEASLLPDTH